MGVSGVGSCKSDVPLAVGRDTRGRGDPWGHGGAQPCLPAQPRARTSLQPTAPVGQGAGQPERAALGPGPPLLILDGL